MLKFLTFRYTGEKGTAQHGLKGPVFWLPLFSVLPLLSPAPCSLPSRPTDLSDFSQVSQSGTQLEGFTFKTTGLFP